MNKWNRLYYQVGAKRRMMVWRVKCYWWRFSDWIDGYTPELCGRCSRWLLRRDTHSVQHTSGAWVRVCGNCHQELYGDNEKY